MGCEYSDTIFLPKRLKIEMKLINREDLTERFWIDGTICERTDGENENVACALVKQTENNKSTLQIAGRIIITNSLKWIGKGVEGRT